MPVFPLLAPKIPAGAVIAAILQLNKAFKYNQTENVVALLAGSTAR
jgi:hypothetical protein